MSKHKIGEWSHENRENKKYRKAQAEGSRRYLEQLHRDAELGRMARVLLKGFSDVFAELAEYQQRIDKGAK